jgi:hypothetical protein
VASPPLWRVINRAKLTASDGGASDNFGYSVGVSGDTAVAGSRLDDTPAGTDAGSAYVFVLSGALWTQQAKLTASDAAASDQFGYSVAVSGDTAVVGTPLDSVPAGGQAGSAYVFVRSGTVWTQQAKLTASDGAFGDQFGWAVAVSGDTAVVGARFDDTQAGTGAGSAYAFVRSAGVWTQQAKLSAPDGAFDEFGYSVAVYGNTAVVGARFDDTLAGTDAGSAYAFVRSGTVWTQQAKLTASDAAASDQFGYSVAVYGNAAVVGAPNGDSAGETDAGSAYGFVRSGGVWTEQTKLVASDGAFGDDFGLSVALYGSIAAVGAALDDTPAGIDAGSAYVFVRSGGVWSERADVTASDGAANDRFGWSVALGLSTGVVGAPFDDTPAGSDAGSAHVFWRS